MAKNKVLYPKECKDKALLAELVALRGNIKVSDWNYKGKRSSVCSDDALIEIASHKPIKPEDFKAINSLGDTFVSKYSVRFAAVTKKYRFAETSNTEIDMTESAKKVLKSLSDRLISLNRKNRMLYLPKLRKKDTIDLYLEAKEDGFLDSLLKGKSIKICKRSHEKNDENRYKDATTIYREVNRISREKGQYNLFLAHPFIIGKAMNEDFEFRAPLVLIPVTLNREIDHFEIIFDKERDAVFNNHLLVINNKFNNTNNSIPESIFELNGNNSKFYDLIIDFYRDEGFNIKIKSNNIVEFKQYNKDDFPVFNNGDYFMENQFILGSFPVFSNAIAIDFEKIINEGKLNKLLDNLLSGIDKSKDENDGFTGYFDEGIENLPIQEIDITYINDLNSSQEKVLKSIANKEAIVIEGPPGTGKSQTITSLITHTIYNDKSVLLISEKKAALDVVYSRLGDLNKSAILIDDLNNKQLFYEQLKRMIDNRTLNFEDDMNIINLSKGIDETIKRLENIATEMFEINSFGLEVYKSFRAKKIYDLNDKEGLETFTKIRTLINEKLKNIKYEKLEKLELLIKEGDFASELKYIVKIISQYPWIKKLKKETNYVEINNVRESLIDWKEKIAQTNNIFSQVWSHFSARINLSSDLKRIFIRKPYKWYQQYKENPDLIINSLSNAQDLISSKTIFDLLPELDKIYLFNIIKISNQFNLSIEEANDYLFYYFLMEEVYTFEKENALIIKTIDNYEDIINALNNKMDEKKKVTKNYITYILKKSINDKIINTKRAPEILNKIESKRKWSVNKFIKTFDFELFNGVKIWMMTPEVVSELLPLEIGLIDLVIFDEASQMYVERGLPAIYRSKKVVIAGDSKQLRPLRLGAGRIEYVEADDEEIETALEEESLLDVARVKYYPPVPLNFHYRSKYAELINFSNYAFYGGRLNVSPNINHPKVPPIKYIKVEGLWENKRNVVEAKEVVRIISEILNSRKNNESIGIITFNTNQREEILDQIEELGRKDIKFENQVRAEESRKFDGEDIGLFVKNIENVQGDERDIIIFSIGYGQNISGRIGMQFGWLSQEGGENRLNVAITRARKQIYIVASIEGHQLDISNTKNDGPKYLKKYLEYSHAVSNRNYEKVAEVLKSFADTGYEGFDRFDSVFEEEVYNALIGEGIHVETQIGVGGYSIDMAIKNGESYILGIECDGKLYHSSKLARERDIHRQKYLESRGWQIHRIWSTNWWNNPGKEIAKIKEIVFKEVALSTDVTKNHNAYEEKIYKNKKNDAMLRLNNNEFVLIKGSIIQRPIESSKNWSDGGKFYKKYNDLFDEYISHNRAIQINDNKAKTTENLSFKNLSHPTCLCSGQNQSGFIYWQGLKDNK